MKIKRLFCCAAAALMYLLSAGCGEPIEPTDSDPLFPEVMQEETTAYTGSMVIESAYTRRTSATTASSTTTTVHTRREEIIVSFSKRDVLEAANLPESYLNYGYLDVDGLSVNYGEVTVRRDNGIYTIPQGYDLHYITQIDVSSVPKGSTVVLTGTLFIKVLVDVPAEEFSSGAGEEPSAGTGESTPEDRAGSQDEGGSSQEEGVSSAEESSAVVTTIPGQTPKTVKAVKVEKTAKFTIVRYTG